MALSSLSSPTNIFSHSLFFSFSFFLILLIFSGIAGNHPLRGLNDDEMCPRFPAVSDAYDGELQDIIIKCGEKLGLQVQYFFLFLIFFCHNLSIFSSFLSPPLSCSIYRNTSNTFLCRWFFCDGTCMKYTIIIFSCIQCVNAQLTLTLVKISHSVLQQIWHLHYYHYF